MIDVEAVQNKVLYLMTVSEKSMKAAMNNKIFLKFFADGDTSMFVAAQFIDWYREYHTCPSLKRIYEKYKDTDWGPKLHIRFRVIFSVGEKDKPTENEFESYVDELKLNWIKNSFTAKLQSYAGVDTSGSADVKEMSEMIKQFGNGFLQISNEADLEDEGEYSFTTNDIVENIEKLKEKDTDKERRYTIGHRPFDKATKGLRPGELLMVLGNVNQGKSMVLANIVYNTWKSGANVLLMTHEMQPFEFDERVICRASAVPYDNILNGKKYLTEQDNAAFNEVIQMFKGKDNHIVTKFLRRTDNVGTIESYIEDLKTKSGFVPDVIVFDSLEHISPMHVTPDMKEHQWIGQVISEFKDFAQQKEVVVISAHQAKTETNDKKFQDISIIDFGRTKVAAEKPDFAMYIRSLTDVSIMNVKMIKARRSAANETWSMMIDYSKCLVANTKDETQSEMFVDASGTPDNFL